MKRRILPDRAHPGGVVLRLRAQERSLLASLPREIDGILAALATEAEASIATSDAPREDADMDEESTRGSEVAGPDLSEIPPSLRRLFPSAYTRDDEAEAGYVAVARPGLLDHHREALQLLADTADAKNLDADQLNGWMTAINDIRLVLGTVLDVREDGEPPGGYLTQQMLYYYYLSGLETEIVDFLSEWLPDPVPGADDLVPEDPWGEPLGGLRWDGTPLPGTDP